MADADSIDAILQKWKQGDCVVGEQWFYYRTSPTCPVTPEAKAAAGSGSDGVEVKVAGFAVLSQTCDIVRDFRERSFVEVAPLVEVDEIRLREIRSGRRPAYAYIRGVADKNLVVDLDRVMTAEKSVLVNWDRVEGCRDANDARSLALALARKRARAAFPDDFVRLAKPLLDRLVGKHGRNSAEGRALRALREIRVRAGPSWTAEEIQLMFWFIRNIGEPEREVVDWPSALEQWLALIPVKGRFREIEGVIQILDDLTARDYVESDPLDLDHLSGPGSSSGV